MDCNAYNTTVHYVDCELSAHYVPQTGILLTLLFITAASLKSFDLFGQSIENTFHFRRWELAALLITIPGVCSSIMVPRYTINGISQIFTDEAPENDPGFAFFQVVEANVMGFGGVLLFFYTIFIWFEFQFELREARDAAPQREESAEPAFGNANGGSNSSKEHQGSENDGPEKRKPENEGEMNEEDDSSVTTDYWPNKKICD